MSRAIAGSRGGALALVVLGLAPPLFAQVVPTSPSRGSTEKSPGDAPEVEPGDEGAGTVKDADETPATGANADETPATSGNANETPATGANADDAGADEAGTPQGATSANSSSAVGADAPEESPQAEPQTSPEQRTIPLGDEDPVTSASDSSRANPQKQDSGETGGYENVTYDDGLVAPVAPPSRFILGLWWDVNLPVGPSRDFVKRLDIAGFQVEGRFRGLADWGPSRLGIGFAATWNSMTEKTRSTIESGNATITGTQVRELQANSLFAKATWAWGSLEAPAPYLGLAVGPSRFLRRLDIGIYRFVDESWHLALQPEVGLEAPVGPTIALAAVRFSYLVGNADAPEQMFLSFSAGLGFD